MDGLGKMRRKVRREVYARLATLPAGQRPCCCAHELVVTMVAEERLRAEQLITSLREGTLEGSSGDPSRDR